jgi:hypothetical protein
LNRYGDTVAFEGELGLFQNPHNLDPMTTIGKGTLTLLHTFYEVKALEPERFVHIDFWDPDVSGSNS